MASFNITFDSTEQQIPLSFQETSVIKVIRGNDTTDATAKASDILAGKTAYAKDKKVTGTCTFNCDSSEITLGDASQLAEGVTAFTQSGEIISGIGSIIGHYADRESILPTNERMIVFTGVEHKPLAYYLRYNSIYSTTSNQLNHRIITATCLPYPQGMLQIAYLSAIGSRQIDTSTLVESTGYTAVYDEENQTFTITLIVGIYAFASGSWSLVYDYSAAE